MMRSVRFYHALTCVYPRRFRREYREPMVQLFADRVRLDGRRRAWSSALRDTAVTAPYEHWETLVHASPLTRTAVAAVGTAIAIGAALWVGAAIIGLLLALLLAWQLYAILRMRGRGLESTAWWHWIAAGGALFAGIFLFFAALPWPKSWREEVPGDVAYFGVVGGIVLSIVLVVTGLMVGFAQFVARRRGVQA